ncbi:lantibiotic dehydratase C-terminal domain-containing protein [Actinomadura sp. NPDC048955]|uniref:lantibiotic dehydratase C-terminal domain-containing protein n=1 Tax=Actinomadura sp. NPDC048955 TaxID=3158228 RepID=UPI0033E267F6
MMISKGLIEGWTPGIYEPKSTAFGGTADMGVAHALFHHDSRLTLQHLAAHRLRHRNPPELGRRRHRVRRNR